MSGDLPAELEGVRKNLFAQQEKEADALKVDHVYALPAELARSLTGFRHDRDISGISGDTFEILELKSGSLLDRLFGNKDKQ